jgi:hypothetical protein
MQTLFIPSPKPQPGWWQASPTTSWKVPLTPPLYIPPETEKTARAGGVEHLPSICEALGLIPCTTKKIIIKR